VAEASVDNRNVIGFFLVSISLSATMRQTALADDVPKPDSKLLPAAIRTIDFVRDIQPIFRRACLKCHGDEKQKGNYRLDVRDIAINQGESYAPNIISGKSADSPLIKFVSGTGDLVMPPEGDRLSPDEIAILRVWIDQGVRWPDEIAGSIRDPRELWSLKPLVRPAVPIRPNPTEKLSPIDAFIYAKLDERKFSSSPEADRRTLIRRVYFDLTGLPPSPADVEQFVADPDAKAYEKLVNRLLESPRYGERWARHWLDAAHFAETHGNDQDRIRENAWPYRDYLIAALNADTPYGKFIEQQIAGDAIFPDEPSLTPALGFLAAGPWDESSLRDIREDSIDRQIARYLDRDDMLTTVINNVTSLTVQCARCHDHKFDPISQRDYYALQAVFSGVERANRRYDADPEIHRQRMNLMRKKSELDQRQPSAMAALMALPIQEQVREWERQRLLRIPTWNITDLELFTSSDGATLTKLPDGSILSGGPRPEKDTVTLVSSSLGWSVSGPNEVKAADDQGNSHPESANAEKRLIRITAIRLDVLTDDSLPRRGPGRQDNGNFHLSEIEVYVDNREKPETLVNPSADFDQAGWEISKALDQNEATAWGIDPREGQPHYALFELKEPLVISAAATTGTDPTEADASLRTTSRLRIVLKQLHGRSHLIGRMKISLTAATPPVRSDKLPDAVDAIVNIPPENRTDEQRVELARYVQLKELERSLSAVPKPALVYAAAADFEPDGSMKPPPGPRPIHLLHRGDIHRPRDEIAPGALSCVPALPAQFDIPASAPESARRVALARWLVDKRNSLTWRSIVNRVWYHHFGRGIVGTLNDFGHMGESPSHPELLDWLAVEFRDGGQSLKELHRLILTSQTYRQRVENQPDRRNVVDASSVEIDERVAVDADNRLLWRMNRIRLDAESIRDAVLAFSGRLDLRMGGPSDRQFDLKPGIHVTPSVDYAKFDPNSNLGRRRSIYRFLFRTLPDPFMESLDCPSGDQITPARNNSVTVQQALALWNDLFIASNCEQIASRIKNDLAVQTTNGTANELSPQVQVESAIRLILGRDPAVNELRDLSAYTSKHGLANLCRLLLNSNEFLFLN
jgi:hypothetical protein